MSFDDTYRLQKRMGDYNMVVSLYVKLLVPLKHYYAHDDQEQFG